MILVTGEILFDIFPEYKRMGGAPFNFAYHMKKLGFPVRFISRVGNDSSGDEILNFLDNHGFNPEDIQIDRNRPTGTVKVDVLGKGEHTFKIATDTAYDHIDAAPIRQLVSGAKPDLIYFGTLIQRTQNNFELIQDMLNRKSPETISFCDINLRPDCYTEHTIVASLNAANILKLNTDELEELTFDSNDKTSHRMSAGQLMRTHCLEMIILTMGEKGSQWFTANQDHYMEPPEASLDIVDTVGAGDAYAAMSVAGILKNLQIEEIISLAGEFASHVCSVQGALIQDPAVYQKFIKKLEK
ncbi:carbohydrate kinase family protein [Desulfobacter latus]|uniref:Carbohydrate kinase n=1 Tax=Desulfobacter latus TaxID=2292 RepID=A0A850SV32_9BACT|nr:carbohydrate kinase [Desulfobacter latus]NWH05224.1 carbohydrate kinase [Desulfobacter latus]